jgi:hypothetical protein
MNKSNKRKFGKMPIIVSHLSRQKIVTGQLGLGIKHIWSTGKFNKQESANQTITP